jgi:hypothetical protein
VQSTPTNTSVKNLRACGKFVEASDSHSLKKKQGCEDALPFCATVTDAEAINTHANNCSNWTPRINPEQELMRE